MEVSDGKQLSFPFFQPTLRVVGVTFGTTSVLAGVIRVKAMTAVAVVALPQMAPHRLGAAGRDGFERGLLETAEWFMNPANLAVYKADRYNI